MIRKLDECVFPDDCFLASVDAESLYPSIPIVDDSFDRVKNVISDFSDFPEDYIDAISQAFRIVLLNHVVRDGNLFQLQTSGTAMGVVCVVVFAILFMFSIEKGVTALVLFLTRFIDDYLVIARSRREFLSMLRALKLNHPGIKYTFKTSNTSIDFLDLTFFKGPKFSSSGKLDCKMFVKPLNRFLYIPRISMHTRSNQIALVRGGIIRCIVNNSSFADYLRSRDAFFTHVSARGIRLSVIKQGVKNLKYSDRASLLSPKTCSDDRRSPLVFNCHWNYAIQALNLGSILRRRWGQVQTIPELEDLFPLLSFSSAPNLRTLSKRWARNPL